MRTAGLTLTIGVLFASAGAFAQTGAAGSSQTGPEKQGATSLQDGRSDSLSSKLSKSGGVIAPQGDVDPAMHVPAPVSHPNSTPIIPPSATGGDTAK